MKAYCGYDYKYIDRLIAKQICFAMYKRPFSDSICFILQNSETNRIVENISELDSKKGFILMPFATTEQNPLVVIHPDIILNNEKDIFDYIRNMNWDDELEENRATISEVNIEENFESYRQDYEVFHDSLKNNEFEKLVLARSLKYKKSNNFSAGVTFNKAIDKYPDAFVYLAHTPESGTWLGCTPEMLLSDNDIFCRTMALAGTMASDSDLKWSKKEYNEQNIVVEYMKQQLDSLSLTYCQNETQNTKAGELIHLKTEFSFRKKDVSTSKILNTLHPTPAVCGFPKQEAFEFIQKNETCKREYYSGFIGPIHIKRQTCLYVNLRCMKIESDSLTLYAGGGILESSQINKEWQETKNKLQTLLSIINE